MILADTSVWVEFLRRGDRTLAQRLVRGEVCIHSMIIGELLLGGLPRDGEVLERLEQLPNVREATHDEVLGFVLSNRIDGSGVGYVDAHLLAAAKLEDDTRLWTRDVKLGAVAARLGIGEQPLADS